MSLKLLHQISLYEHLLMLLLLRLLLLLVMMISMMIHSYSLNAIAEPQSTTLDVLRLNCFINHSGKNYINE